MAGEQKSILGTNSFTPYAAGAKIYNSISSSPTRGAVDKSGYATRDRQMAARRNALLAKMKGQQSGSFANSNVQRFVK